MRGVEKLDDDCEKYKIKHLENVLLEACESIDIKYFRIKFAGDPEEKYHYKERVYTYELYHQLRCRFKDDEYSLAGEMNKLGNYYFDKELKGKNPDFIVHTQGTNIKNIAIIEVKRIESLNKKGVGNDLNKLTRFVSKQQLSYKFGIELFFGDTHINSFENKIRKIFDEYCKDHEDTRKLLENGEIKILFHNVCGKKPQFIDYNQLKFH